jgi:hypothetical protein
MFNAKHTSKEMNVQNIELKKLFLFFLNEKFIKKTLHSKNKNILSFQKKKKTFKNQKET